MQKTIIRNAHVISPDVDIENAVIIIEGKTIKSVGKKDVAAKPGDTVVDVKGQYVMPGFIDVHTHGANTHDFCDADPKAIFEFAKAKLEEAKNAKASDEEIATLSAEVAACNEDVQAWAKNFENNQRLSEKIVRDQMWKSGADQQQQLQQKGN